MLAFLNRIVFWRKRGPVDIQLQSRDCGISAAKIICDQLGIKASRKWIANRIELGPQGAQWADLKTCLEELGIRCSSTILDCSTSAAILEELKAAAPCITLIQRARGLHYVVVSEIRGGKIVVSNPASGRRERWDTSYFCSCVYRPRLVLPMDQQSSDTPRRLLDAELKQKGINPDMVDPDMGWAEGYNRLQFFNAVCETYRVSDSSIQRQLLEDILGKNTLFGRIKVPKAIHKSNEGVEIYAPQLLRVDTIDRDVDTRHSSSESSWWVKFWNELQPFRGLVGVFFGTALATAFIGYLSVLFTQALIDHVLPMRDVTIAWLFIAGLIAYKVTELSFSLYSKWMAIYVASHIDDAFLSRFSDALLRLPLEKLLGYQKGDLLVRVSDSLMAKGVVISFVARVVVNSVMALFAALFLFVIHAKLATFVLTMTVLLGLLFVLLNSGVRQAEMERARAKSDLLGSVSACIEGAQGIRASGLEIRFLTHLKRVAGEYIRAQAEGKRMGFIGSLLSLLLVDVAWIVSAIVLISGYNNGEAISIGVVVTFLAFVTRITHSTKVLLEESLKLQEQHVAVRRLFDFTNATPSPDPDAQRIQHVQVERIDLTSISYSYPGGVRALAHVDLCLQKGEVIHIRGANGAGKSSLARIAAGLVSPDTGEIRLNGLPLTCHAPLGVRRAVYLVSADDPIFPGSIIFNLTLGRPVPFKEVVCHCKELGLLPIIQRDPAGFDRVFADGGRELSTGQKRKILFARAMLSGADIVILDEVFRGLDHATRAVCERMIATAKDRGFALIAHEPFVDLQVDRSVDLINGCTTAAPSDMDIVGEREHVLA